MTAIAMMTSSFENLIFLLDYCDGPITGVAFFQGAPHYFTAELDEASDAYTQEYQLTALSENTLKAVVAARSAWIVIKQQADRGNAVEFESLWRAQRAEMDEMIAHDCAASAPLRVSAKFIRVRETGTNEDSFMVAWTSVASGG